MKKSTIITAIFVCSYGIMMRKPFTELDNYNRKIAQQNIHKFNIEIEEE